MGFSISHCVKNNVGNEGFNYFLPLIKKLGVDIPEFHDRLKQDYEEKIIVGVSINCDASSSIEYYVYQELLDMREFFLKFQDLIFQNFSDTFFDKYLFSSFTFTPRNNTISSIELNDYNKSYRWQDNILTRRNMYCIYPKKDLLNIIGDLKDSIYHIRDLHIKELLFYLKFLNEDAYVSVAKKTSSDCIYFMRINLEGFLFFAKKHGILDTIKESIKKYPLDYKFNIGINYTIEDGILKYGKCCIYDYI